MERKLLFVVNGDVKGSRNNVGETKKMLLEAFSASEKAFPDLSLGGGLRLYRGDGFQGAFGSASQGMRGVLFLYSFFRSGSERLGLKKASLRMGIGIGEGVVEGGNVLESTGEAFQLSGTALDCLETKKERDGAKALRFETPWKMATNILNMESLYIEEILNGLSISQARALMETIRGASQNEISEIMNVSQPNVSKMLSKARHKRLEAFGRHIQEVVDFFAKLPEETFHVES